MNAGARLTVFGLGLVAAFGAALGVGRALGPADLGEPAAHDEGGHGGYVAELPPGLSAHDGRYGLVMPTRLDDDEIFFNIRDDEELVPVTDLEVVHEQRLHLVVVRRDATGYHHLHPTQDDNGLWSTPVDLDPGTYKLFADFTPVGGDNVVLGADLFVPGDYEPREPLDMGSVDHTGGYRAQIRGDLVAGQESTVSITVTKDDLPVDDLDPYLGAYGHLVVLRGGDLAYLHVHPEDGPAGPEVRFTLTPPTEGTYHLYFDFQHDGVVHTAHFAFTSPGRISSGGN